MGTSRPSSFRNRLGERVLSVSLFAMLTMVCAALPRDTELVTLDHVSTIPGMETVRGAPSPLGGTIRDDFDASFAQEIAAVTCPPDADSRPLQRHIATIYDMEVMQRVAEERNCGRRLNILTTNIDTEVPIL